MHNHNISCISSNPMTSTAELPSILMMMMQAFSIIWRLLQGRAEQTVQAGPARSGLHRVKCMYGSSATTLKQDYFSHETKSTNDTHNLTVEEDSYRLVNGIYMKDKQVLPLLSKTSKHSGTY